MSSLFTHHLIDMQYHYGMIQKPVGTSAEHSNTLYKIMKSTHLPKLKMFLPIIVPG